MSGPAYAAPSSPPVVQGVLYDLDGSPATAGQLVTLVAWPSSDVLAALKPGDAVPTTVVDTTATSASGAFSLGFSSPDAARRLADSNGDINLSVQSMAGGVAHTYNVIGHTDP